MIKSHYISPTKKKGSKNIQVPNAFVVGQVPVRRLRDDDLSEEENEEVHDEEGLMDSGSSTSQVLDLEMATILDSLINFW